MKSGGAAFTIGDVLGRAGELFRASLPRFAVAAAVIFGGGMIIDTGGFSESAVNGLSLALSFATVFLQFWLIATLLEDLRLNFSTGRRFPAYFFRLGIVANLAILLGLVLLIVPGIILFVRWYVAAPLLIGSNDRFTTVLEESWRVTGPHFWPILGALAAVYVPSLAAGLAGVVLIELLGVELVGFFMANLGLTAFMIVGCYMSVAIYSFLRGKDSVLEIFE